MYRESIRDNTTIKPAAAALLFGEFDESLTA
jgi:hypothetical protein